MLPYIFLVRIIPSNIIYIQTENEVRDGAAGGFNERQDRVSAAAVEIDEEGYDISVEHFENR